MDRIRNPVSKEHYIRNLQLGFVESTKKQSQDLSVEAIDKETEDQWTCATCRSCVRVGVIVFVEPHKTRD